MYSNIGRLALVPTSRVVVASEPEGKGELIQAPEMTPAVHLGGLLCVLEDVKFLSLI